MLEDGTYLHLKTDLVQFWMLRVDVGRLGDAANVMQGEVAETIDFVRFALVDGVLPIDFEQAFQDGSHLIHVIVIERDHADAHQVGNVMDALVFFSFKLEFSRKGAFRLHAMLHGGHDDARLGEKLFQFLGNHFSHLLIDGQQLAVLREQILCVGIEGRIVHVLRIMRQK